MWTDARVELLKALWADGLSAAQCAAQLGGFDHCSDGGRSAVIGKVHRLGLAGRTKKVSQHRIPRARPARPSIYKKQTMPVPSIQSPVVEIPTPTLNDEVPPEPLRLQLLDLTAETCRWPYGDTQIPESFYFCGIKTSDITQPYCSYHRRIGYQPVATRRS